jgi:hypothetical protein
MTQWLAAFDIFVAICCERYPMEASNLMKYAHIITSLPKQSGIEGALYYNRSFRQWRQKDPVNLPWEGVVTELHCEALAMGLQTKRQNNSNGNKQPCRGIFGRPRTGGRLQQNNTVTPSITKDIAETKNVASVTSVKSVNKTVMDKSFAPSVRPQINFKQMHQENLNNLPQNKIQTHLNDHAITTPIVNVNLISL